MILDYKGTQIFYNDEGQGESIIFLHGFLENSSMWQDIIEEIKSNYRCVSVDLLGHGKTGVTAEIHSMELMAEVVNAVLMNLKINKAVFIGHSMGGYVALAFAEKFPDKLTGLCLMNSTALPDSEERKKIRERAIEVIKSDKKIFISMAISNLFAPKNLLVFNEEINKLKEEAYRLSVKAINSALTGMKLRPSRVEVYSKLKCKKLVILGERDSILNIEDQKLYLKNINTEITILDGGHMPQIENKYEITDKIKQFIEN